MSALKDKYPKLSNIMAILSAIIGCLLLVATYDNLHRGSPYLFVTVSGIMAAGLGLANAFCRFRFKRWFHFFGDWFSITGLFLAVSYWLVYRHTMFKFVLVGFGAFWVFNLIFSRLNRPPQRFKLKKAIKLHGYQLLLIGTIIIGLWWVPIESMLNLVQVPNRDGAQSYSGPSYALSISGGFLQRVNLATPTQGEEIIIKQTAPQTTVKFNSQKTVNVRINILNAPKNHQFYLNGQQLISQAYSDGQQLIDTLATGQTVNSETVFSKDYTGTRKGYWADLQLGLGASEFSVAPASQTGDLTFYVVSDLHSGYDVNLPLLQQMMQTQPDFIVFNGDIVNFGIRSEYVVASGLAEMSPVPIYTAVGNHEAWQGGLKHYLDYFGPLTNSFTYKDCLLVFLDSHSGYIGQSQFNWLTNTLSESSAKHKFVFSHMPPFDPATGQFDDGNYRFKDARNNIYSQAESDQLLNILNTYGAEVLFTGHTHHSGQVAIGNATLYSTGSLGGAIDGGDDVSYLKVAVGQATTVDIVKVIGAEQVAGGSLSSYLHVVQIFAGPFLLDKAIRLNLTIALLILSDYLIKRRNSKATLVKT
jgi:Icc protein